MKADYREAWRLQKPKGPFLVPQMDGEYQVKVTLHSLENVKLYFEVM